MKYEEIDEAIKVAMQNHSEDTGTLRLIKAEALVFQKSKGASYIPTEDDMTRILTKMATQRKESIAQYKEAGRDDLVASEQKELTFIESLLPAIPSDDDVRAYAIECIERYVQTMSVGADMDYTLTMKDMKPILDEVKQRFNAPTVGKIVSEALRKAMGQ